jgi:thiol-disulfide isomerase/thioredoxin
MITRRSPGFVIGLCALVLSSAAAAQELRPFEPGSLAKITAARAGRPFVLSLWSLQCPHCPQELALFGEMLKKHPGLDLILVSTDTPDHGAAVSAALARHRLMRAEAWVYADAFTERLQYEVDRHWRGELPRTYFYSADGRVRGVSGTLDARQVEEWLARQTGKTAHE